MRPPQGVNTLLNGPNDLANLADEIHVWTFDIIASEAIAARFEPVLSEEEVDRAARFHFRKLRDSFVLTRGILRHLLGRYLGVPPAAIRISYGSKGKPALADNKLLQFNMSHSGDKAIIALTRDCAIGVDVERVRFMTDMQQIAERFFCPEEAAEILSFPDCQRAFFFCWTRKEAFIKAIGDGLSVPLDSFRVTVRADSPERLVHPGSETGAVESWTLRGLSLGEGYEGAVAYAGSNRHLSIFPIEDVVGFFNV
jgi:4'-phosphopantetheinyl transferase